MQIQLFAHIVFTLALTLTFTSAQDVSLYEDLNQEGFFLEEKNVQECRNLRYGKKTATSLSTHGGCIVLYEEDNCSGEKLRISPNIHSHNDLRVWNFNDKTSSIGPCDNTQDLYKAPQVGFYDSPYQKDLLYEMEELCGCKNLPSFVRNKISAVNTHSGCVRLFDGSDCNGQSVELSPGSPSHGNLADLGFDNKAISVSTCADVPARCIKLTTTVKEIKFLQDIDSLIQSAAKRPVDIIANFVIQNNSTEVQRQKISQSKTFSEEFTVEKIQGLSSVHRVNVEVTAGISAKAGLPFVAEAEISTELKVGYGYEATSSSQSRTQTTTRKDKTFSIDKEVSIAPCTYAVVRSYVNVVDNMPIQFQLSLRIQGTKNGKGLSAAELTASLPAGIKFDKVVDDTTIMASTKGTMKASVGIDTFFSADQRKLDNCG